MSSIQGPGNLDRGIEPLPEINVPKPRDGKGGLGGIEVQRDSGVRIDVPELKVGSDPIELRDQVVQKDEGPVNLGLRQEARYRALPTKDQLIEKAGRPKDDIKYWFFGSRTKKMSTAYKAILKQLESYQGTMGHQDKVSRTQVQELRDHLLTLKDSTQAYQNRDSHSRKEEIAALNHQVRGELDVLNNLLLEMDEQGSTWPDGVSLKDGMDFARQGVKLADLQATMQQDLANSGMDLEELQPYRDAGFSGIEAKLLKESGLGLEGGKMYRAVNLKVSEDTLFGDFNSSKEKSFKKLGAGAMNTVYEVKYNLGSGEKVGVFKPLPDIDASSVEHGWVASKTGVNHRNPQTAMRNLATVDIAKKLNFEVVPETRSAEHKGKIGILMDKATGQEARKTDKSLFNDPGVRKEVTKLQLLDALTGQGDRHHGNYFVHKDKTTGKVTVTGVDNDQCFGSALKDPNGIARGRSSSNYGFRGVKLPPVIDSEMAKSIRDLKPEDLEDLLGGKLTPEEISATKDRLAAMKSHIDRLEQKGNIISPDDWGTENASNLLSDPSTSYIGRETGGRRAPKNTAEKQHDVVMDALNKHFM